MRIGLRIDVDTLRGTRLGVPALCRLLKANGIRATFFFSVGPDNMGRNLRRLFRPAFLIKMLRSGAPRLYGWDIIFKGTLWPGPVIGKKLPEVISAARDAGHEIGLHAWDHYTWQTGVMNMAPEDVRRELTAGFDSLRDIAGVPCCSAAPGWRCTDAALVEKEAFPFRYNSDCRGTGIFRPVAGGTELKQPQVPVTLPTYDELAGRGGVPDAAYNDHIISLLRPDDLNVLTIHAEAEGIACASLFEEFIGKTRALGAELVPLGDLLPDPSAISRGTIVQKTVPGREGTVAVQAGEGVDG